jgi:adenosylmethionine-8-amino-7-oxononanoate aminotransferase
MAGVEVVADTASKQYFPPAAAVTPKLMEAMLDRGLYTRAVMDCICLAPPLVTTDEQIDRMVDIVRETIPAVVSAAQVGHR